VVDKKSKTLLKAKISAEVLTAQRDHYRAQAEFLDKQLAKAEARAALAEQRLHQITMTMAEISQNAISASAKSSATEVLMDGRSILRLNNPVGQNLSEKIYTS
jgi:ethanolamine utilization protein EutA (predicted chaperonin)